MDNSRRTFDRSREPGLKKPRLAEGSGPGPIGRGFNHRPVVGAATAATRFRSSDSDSSDLRSSGGGYEPQPLPQQQLHEELLTQYKRALAELTFNSKPIITSLTIIAGENLQAAKSIAAIVCANIHEVPSDQKLPSLYLLDSIVKNIGRDYIRYFAARLPEIFCKAYRQVDPSVQSSMRHLFGTWKGVFPPQTLQIIQKELAFASLVNGSSSGTTRNDTQSPRPPQSIHVNPEYLERQQLQQSSRSKVMVNKMMGGISNSEVDAERLERVTTLNSGQPWVDPSAKMRSIQPIREPLSEPFSEKGAGYGDYDYASVVPLNSSTASVRTGGRISVQGRDRPLYAVGDIVPETISSQRNGINVKPGFPNYLASKSSSIDGRPPTAKTVVSKSNNLSSNSWKNSEEEEFMWDTHSRRLDHDIPGILNSSKRDGWTPDGSENLDFSSHLHDAIPDLDSLSNEQKDQTASKIRTESDWLSGLHKKDSSTHSGDSAFVSVKLEGSSGARGGLPITSTSLVKANTRPQMGSSRVQLSGSPILANVAGNRETSGRQRFLSREAASPSGESPVCQRSPSPPFQPRDPRKQLQYMVERDNLHVPQPDAKPFEHSGSLNAAPNKQYPFSHPLQVENLEPETSGHNKKLLLPGKSGTVPSMEGNKVSDCSASPAVEISEQLNTSSLLAAVMKSGIFFNSIAPSTAPGQELVKGGKLLSHSGNLTAVSLAPAGKSVESNALSDSTSHDSKLDTLNKLEDKIEQTPLAEGLPCSSQVGGVSAQAGNVKSKAVNPLSNLLSSLLAKGLISASKTESDCSAPHQLPIQSPDNSSSTSPPVSSVPLSSETMSSAVDEVPLRESVAKRSAASVDSNKKVVDSLVGLEFRPDVVREFHPSVIRSLSDDLPHRCSLCGIRLKLKERLDRHAEWHTMKSPEQSAVGGLSRRWYVKSGDWVLGNFGDSGVESCSVGDEPEEITEQIEVAVPADEDQCACILCAELFEDYFDLERNEWMFKGAVYLTVKPTESELVSSDTGSASGPIVHEHCLSENSLLDLGVAGAAKTELSNISLNCHGSTAVYMLSMVSSALQPVFKTWAGKRIGWPPVYMLAPVITLMLTSGGKNWNNKEQE